MTPPHKTADTTFVQVWDGGHFTAVEKNEREISVSKDRGERVIHVPIRGLWHEVGRCEQRKIRRKIRRTESGDDRENTDHPENLS